MRKWTSILLCMMLAVMPLCAQAYSDFSWLDSWLEEDSSSYADPSGDDVLSGLFGGSSYEDSHASTGDDLFSALEGLLGGGSAYDYGSSYGDSYSSTEDDLLSALEGLLGGSSSYDWNSSGYDWGGGSTYGWDDYSSYSSGNDLFGMLGNWVTTGSGSDVTAWQNPDADDFDQKGSKKDTWALYWYLCGSDLETGSGFATDDLAEMLKVTLPDNVTVVIQTGGARRWQNNFVKADRLQRWLYQGDELRQIDEERSASMGSPETLAQFLDFCNRNFPADKQAVLFWNHGGGSVTGAAFDELYRNDALTLAEMKAAFSAVFDVDANNPPLEMVGFDTCLMGTVDVAHTFSDVAHYLVGSEEMEPGTGWDYTALFSALAKNPGMNGAQLGREICVSYGAACKAAYTQDSITLSVVDLTKTADQVKAYERYGADALRASTEDSGFISRFRRAAQKCESYGANSREEGYSNMVDLGHLARLTSDILPSARQVLDGLDECVLYRVNGAYRSEATGLSCFYSFNGNIKEIQNYVQQGVGDAFAEYYLYSLTGQMSQQGMAYLQMQEEEVQQLPVFETLADTNWDGMALTVDDEGVACLNLGPQADDILAGIGIQLYFINEEKDEMLILGTDNDMDGSMEEGVFYDNFRGVWGSLNGHLVHMSLTFEGEDYNLYTVPVLLNGEECHLQVAYDFSTEEWEILGARYGLEPASGMAYKDIRLLRRGDELTILWYAASYTSDDDFYAYESHTFTIGDELIFAESPLQDGLYGMVFEMWDAQGNYAYSEPVLFECVDGDIFTSQG